MEDLYRTVAEEIDSRAEREKFLNQAAISPAAFSELTPTAIPASSSIEDSSVAPRNEEPRRAVPFASGSQTPSRWKYSFIAISGALILAIVVAAHFVRSRAANSPTTVQDKPQESHAEAASAPSESKPSAVDAKPSPVETAPLVEKEIPKSAEPKPKTSQTVHLSPEVARSLLITEITPAYPPLARQAHIQGMVVIDADISRDGNVENLKATSGHPLLIPAAIDAVKKWKYKPYIVNGEPTAVNTQISVNFTLTGG
jgi:TonB family protein